MTTAKEQREARLAAQLRANLVKRKAQARAAPVAARPDAPSEPIEPDPTR